MKIEFEEKIISLLTPRQKLFVILLAETHDPLDQLGAYNGTSLVQRIIRFRQNKSLTVLLACVKKIITIYFHIYTSWH